VVADSWGSLHPCAKCPVSCALDGRMRSTNPSAAPANKVNESTPNWRNLVVFKNVDCYICFLNFLYHGDSIK
jgi:hypothetical protein